MTPAMDGHWRLATGGLKHDARGGATRPLRAAHPSSRLVRGGFSLIEVLVVVSIIVILLGIAVAGINVAYQRSEEATTRALLGSLAGVEKEYRAQTGQPIPASANGDLNDTPNKFLDVVQDNSKVASDFLRRIDSKLRKESGGRITEVRDPWDNLVRYNDGSGGGGMPRAQYPYFASAGADGQWGSYANGDPSQPDAAAKDNILSFEVK